MHSTYSDGILSPEEIVKVAKQFQLSKIGICDHGFSKKLPASKQISDRLEQYLLHLNDLKSSCEIELLVGIEIDVSKYFGVDPIKLPFNTLNQFDYILFEYINTEFEYWGKVGSRDITEIINIRNQLTIPIGLAHNDLQQNFLGKESQITELLANEDIFLELNQSEKRQMQQIGRNSREGKDYYCHFSSKLLKLLKEFTVKVIIGTDSHSGSSINRISDVMDFIKSHQLCLHELAL
ncbi:MAG: PHP domain-containing protein [Candidatus Hodarchaeota archaeon]